MQGVTVPNDVTVTTTRNYGETAKDKSDELLEPLTAGYFVGNSACSTLPGVARIRVVLLAIPVTLALTMTVSISSLHHQSRNSLRFDF